MKRFILFSLFVSFWFSACYEDKGKYSQIRNEVERLPEAMRKVFNLTLLDMSIPEIAEALDISENTVRNQRARAREILRARLKDKIFFLFLLCDIY